MSAKLGDLSDEYRCTSTSRQSGTRCKNPRCIGLEVCETHAPKTSSTLEVRNVAKLTREIVKRGYGSATVDTTHEGANPITGLAWEIRRTAGNIEFIEDKLKEMSDDDIVWGRSARTVKTTLADELADVLGDIEGGYPRFARNEDSYTQEQEIAGMAVWAQLYLRERRHYVEMLKLAISSGLEHRRISIMEEHVLLVNNVIVNIISKIGANPEDPAIRAMVHHEMETLLPARRELMA